MVNGRRMNRGRLHAVNSHFEDKDELQILQEMVLNLGLSEADETPPGSKTGCRKMLRGVHVHILDYVHKYGSTLAPDDELEEEIVLPSRRKLRERCLQIGTFPKEKAKNDNLKVLLRELYI